MTNKTLAGEVWSSEFGDTIGRTLEGEIWIREYGLITDGFIRGCFKILLLIFIFFIGIVGEWCLSLWVKNQLLRGRTVRLDETAGWIYGPSLAKAAVQFRQLPGGCIGWLMLITTAFDLVGGYGVVIAVTSQPLTKTHVFPSGGIVNASSHTHRPDFRWEAFRWAAAAQDNSRLNAAQTGMGIPHYGIYRMVTNDTSFMAREADELGYWACASVNTEPLVYNQTWKEENYPNATEIYDADIYQDLRNRNLLYGAWYVSQNVSKDNDQNSTTSPSRHTTIISVSNDTYGELYNISVAIDIERLDDQGGKKMSIFNCALKVLNDPERTVESIARVIDIAATMHVWWPAMVGAFYPGLHSHFSQPLKNVETLLQYYFNAMIMVSGVKEDVQQMNVQKAPLGITFRATLIPTWIIVVYVIIFVFALSFFAFTLYLYFANEAAGQFYDHHNKDGKMVPSREIMENMPLGLLGWMGHAAYTSRDADAMPQPAQMKDWAISTTWHAGRRLGFVKANELGLVECRRKSSLPGYTPIDEHRVYAQAQETEFFGGAKKGRYIALHTREVTP